MAASGKQSSVTTTGAGVMGKGRFGGGQGRTERQ